MIVECSIKHHVRWLLAGYGCPINSKRRTATRAKAQEAVMINEGDRSRMTLSEHRQNRWGKPKPHSMPGSNSAFYLARPPQEWCFLATLHRKGTSKAFPAIRSIRHPVAAVCNNTFCPQTSNWTGAETVRCSFRNDTLHTSRFPAV